MAKKKKLNWVQDGSKLTLTINAPRKHRRPVMLYSIEFNFKSNIDDKKKTRYSRKSKHKNRLTNSQTVL